MLLLATSKGKSTTNDGIIPDGLDEHKIIDRELLVTVYPVQIYRACICRFFRIASCYVHMYCAPGYTSQPRSSQRPQSCGSHSGTRMITAPLFPLRTATSSHPPIGWPAIGTMIWAAGARALKLDYTVCLCRVGAATDSKNIQFMWCWTPHFNMIPVLTKIRRCTIYFETASSSASVRSTGFHIITHRFLVCSAITLDLLVCSEGVGNIWILLFSG